MFRKKIELIRIRSSDDFCRKKNNFFLIRDVNRTDLTIRQRWKKTCKTWISSNFEIREISFYN